MATDVVMPQMGESIAEGTIVRWIKKVGDPVERDEPLFEISTDKVDAEIPSPVAGVVTEIRAKEGETVPVNSVVAVIGAGRRDGHGRRPQPAAGAAPRRTPPAPRAAAPPRAAPAPQADGRAAARPSAPTRRSAAERTVGAAVAGDVRAAAASRPRTRVRQRSSPLVRKIAKEHNVDISQIRGHRHRRPRDEGRHPRLHRRRRATGRGAAPAGGPQAARPRGAAGVRPPTPPAPAPSKPASSAAPDTIVPMSVMRKKIAEHMVAEPAHVGARALGLRGQLLSASRRFARRRRPSTSAPARSSPICRSSSRRRSTRCARCRSSTPRSTATTSSITRTINVGIAVALDWGLIVPVIKNADEKNLLGLSRAVADLANRARSKQLKPDEVSGGTFTITNPGRVRRAVRHADHQPAAGRDPRRRRRSRSGRSSIDDAIAHPADGLPVARLRSPDHRRRRRRRVHVARQAARSRTGIPSRSRSLRSVRTPRGPAARSRRRTPTRSRCSARSSRIGAPAGSATCCCSSSIRTS